MGWLRGCGAKCGDHEPLVPRKLPFSVTTAFRRRTLTQLERACWGSMLLGLIAICATSSHGLDQDAFQGSSSATALQTTATTRESSSQPKRAGHAKEKEFNSKLFKSFLNISSFYPSSVPMEVLDMAVELMHSLSQVPTNVSFSTVFNVSFIDVIGLLLFRTLTICDKEFVTGHQEKVTELIDYARQNLLAPPIPNSNNFISGKYVQIAVITTKDASQGPFALCSARDKESQFEEIPRDAKPPTQKCYFTLEMSNATFRNVRNIILAYDINLVIRPLPRIGHPIFNSRVVDVIVEPSTVQESEGDQVISIFFKPSLTSNTTKGCAYWNKTLANWTTEDCWVDVTKSPDVCHCNLSAHLDEDATGGQYIVYEFSDAPLFNATRLSLLQNAMSNMPAASVLNEVSIMMDNLTFLPPSKETLGYLWDILNTGCYVDYLPENDSTMLKLMEDSRKWLLSAERESGCCSSCGMCLSICMSSSPAFSDSLTGIAFPRGRRGKDPPTLYSHSDLESANIFSNKYTFVLNVSESVSQNTKKLALITYPSDISGYPLPSTMYPIYSFRVVDVVIESSNRREREDEMLISIFFKPSSMTNATKVCSFWSKTLAKWTTEGCWIHPEISPDVCHCNLSAHLNEAPTGGQYLVYEFTDVIFNKTSLHALQKNAAYMKPQIVIEEASKLLKNLTLFPQNDDTLNGVASILLLAIDVVSNTANISITAILPFLDGARNCIRFSEPDVDYVTTYGASLNIIVFSFTSCGHLDSYAAVTIPRERGKLASLYRRSELKSITLYSNRFLLSLNVSESAFLNTFGIAFIVYPLQFIAHPLPAIGHPIHNSRIVDVVIEPITGRNTDDDILLSIFFKPSLKVNTTKGCAYWSTTLDNWTNKGCWVDDTFPDVCHCNLSAHLDKDATGGQYIVYEFSDVFFNETSLTYLEDHSPDLTTEALLAETGRLMHNLTLLPASNATLDHIWRILNISIDRYNLDVDTNMASDSSSLLGLMKGARKSLWSLDLDTVQLYIQFIYLCHSCLNIFMFPSTTNVSNSFAAIAFPRRNREHQFPYRHKQLETIDIFSIHFTLSVTVSKSVTLNARRIGFITYPKYFNARPLPSVGSRIHSFRVVDVVIEPITKPKFADDEMISIFFKPSLSTNTTKGCAYWSKTLANWTTEDCWVNLAKSPDVCHCNLSAHLAEDATGGQYIVYELSDVFFNVTSYNYVLDHKHVEPTDFFIAEASDLMRNLSLIPGNWFKVNRLVRLVSSVLNAVSSWKCEVTNEHIKNLYRNARNIIKSDFEWKHTPTFFVDGGVAIIFDKPKPTHQFTVTLRRYFSVNLSTYTHNNSISTSEVTYSLSLSRSVAEQNERIGYMLFAIDQFLFSDTPDIFNTFQVHNHRIVDITLVPNADVESTEDQFIDIRYTPSPSAQRTVNTRVGCAFWSDLHSAWTTEGCEVFSQLTPRGCQCNLSAHFDENREGGQYAIFEYSDVFLDYEAMASFMNDQYAEENELREMYTFIQNLTKIGYIGSDVNWANTIFLKALVTGESALRSSANLSNALMEEFHVIIHRWASDSTHDAAIDGSIQNGSVISPSPVALLVNDVLSNEVIRPKVSLLQQLSVTILRLGLPESDNGLIITTKNITYLSCNNDSRMSDEPQFMFYFSVDSKDKVLFALILYPESKTLLPLPFSLGAISSYHVVEATLVSDGNADPLPNPSRLLTLGHISDGPSRTDTSIMCAVWTGADWSTETCWPETGNDHACTCNLSAHDMSVGTFLPFLIYETIDATNFALKDSLSALDVLYVISSTTSLICLSLIALTAAVFPLWRAELGHKIMLHLSLVLFLYQTLRLYRETHHVYTAVNRNVAGFVAFAVVTHYSRLTHYAWMLVMSTLQLRRLLTMVGAVDTPHLLLKVNLLAWGVPLVPLVVLLSWDRETHFSRPDILTHLVLYLVPGFVVTLANLILLVIILARLFSWFGWGVVDDLGRHGVSDSKLMWRRVATALLLFFLFGIPTAFEMSNDFWGHSLTLEVLFKVFDPVRGAVLFVFFIVLDKKTFDMWRQKLQSLVSRNITEFFEMW